MSDVLKKSRFPNLGKLSIALLEHTVKPVIGEKAIDEIKLPVVEKDLIKSLETALEKAEKRFVSEYGDKEICEIVLNLPLSDLPSVIQAVRTFYSNPNDPALGHVLIEQLKASFRNVSLERIDLGVSTYIRFLRNELANLSGDIREKLGIHATFEIQNNTARIADTLDRLEKHITDKNFLQKNVLVTLITDDESILKSNAFQLGYHLGALDFFVSYQRRGIPLSPLLPNWIDEAQNKCTVLANAIGLVAPNEPIQFFDSVTEQLTAKPIVLQKCFHAGNIIGRGWFFGISPMRAGVIPPDDFVLKRLKQAEILLVETDSPKNILSTIRQIWENVLLAAQKSQFDSGDLTDSEMNQAIEGIIRSIEKHKSITRKNRTTAR